VNENIRRRKAAFLPRQRAADALDEANRLDGLPAMRLLATDVQRIAEALNMDSEKLTDVVMGLWPGHDD
jgi:hypothetical protein